MASIANQRQLSRHHGTALIVSLLLHLAVFVALFHLEKQKIKETLTAKNSQPVDFVIAELSSAKNIRPSRSSGRSRRTLQTMPNRLPRMQQLWPQIADSLAALQQKAGNGAAEDFDPHSDNTGADWGSGGSQFKRITEYNLMSRIHHQVEGLLYYPTVLATHKVEGAVNARLVINDGGHCDWPRSQISSGSPYFRIFVLDLLKKLCRQNYEHEVKGRGMTNVDLSFQFAITERDDQQRKDEQSRIIGNVLMFYRSSHQSIAQWRLGPLTGLFPLPFVNLDFAWLKENWETLVEHKDPFGDFHEVKD